MDVKKIQESITDICNVIYETEATKILRFLQKDLLTAVKDMGGNDLFNLRGRNFFKNIDLDIDTSDSNRGSEIRNINIKRLDLRSEKFSNIFHDSLIDLMGKDGLKDAMEMAKSLMPKVIQVLGNAKIPIEFSNFEFTGRGSNSPMSVDLEVIIVPTKYNYHAGSDTLRISDAKIYDWKVD